MKKIIAMSLVFLFLMSIGAQSVRAEGGLSDIFDMIKKWFESSPFGNIFSMPVKRTETVKMSFYPETFGFDVTEIVNISSNESTVSGFKGHILANLKDDVLISKSSESSIMVEQKLGEITINELSIPLLELNGMEMVLTSGNWTESAENGSITIKDFLGTVIITKISIELEGNVSATIKG